jgi:hypothetical protein
MLFYLASQAWVIFLDTCWGIVQKLMKLNRNNLEHSLRVTRAIKLVFSTV